MNNHYVAENNLNLKKLIKTVEGMNLIWCQIVPEKGKIDFKRLLQ